MTRLKDMLRSNGKTALGVVTIVTIVGLFLGAITQIPSRLLEKKGETVTAVFPGTLLLTKGDEVRVEGVKVGKVRDLKLAPDGRSTTVKMDVLKDAQPVYANARATLRWRTVLGANLAVDLERGTPTTGVLHGTIPLSHTATQVELEDVVDGLQGGAAKGLKTTLSEVPHALSDPQAPRVVLQKLHDVSPDVTKSVAALRGERGDAVRELVSHTNHVVSVLNTEPTSITDLVSGGGKTLQTTAARAQDLRRTLEISGPLSPQITNTAHQLDHTLTIADPLLAKLNAAAGDVAPTVKKLHPVVSRASTLLTSARPLVRSLRPAVTQLAAVSRQGSPLLDALTPSILRLQNGILPDLAVKSPESGLPTYAMVGSAITGLGAAYSHYDQNGNNVRFLASGGERVIGSLPCQTYLTDPVVEKKIACDALQTSLDNLLKGIKPSAKGKP